MTSSCKNDHVFSIKWSRDLRSNFCRSSWLFRLYMLAYNAWNWPEEQHDLLKMDSEKVLVNGRVLFSNINADRESDTVSSYSS